MKRKLFDESVALFVAKHPDVFSKEFIERTKQAVLRYTADGSSKFGRRKQDREEKDFTPNLGMGRTKEEQIATQDLTLEERF